MYQDLMLRERGSNLTYGMSGYREYGETGASETAYCHALITHFRDRYPTASLNSELLTIHDGNWVVRALIRVGELTMATGLGAAGTIELAEDRARLRALEALGLLPKELPGRSQDQSYELQVRLTTNPNSDRDIAEPRLRPAQPPTISMEALEGTEIHPRSLPNTSRSEMPSFNEVSSFNTGHPGQTSYTSPSSNTGYPSSLGTTGHTNPASSPSHLGHADPLDLSDAIAQTTVEMRRLGWSESKGRTYLQKTYGKRSRQHLTDDELFEFLGHLKSQPSPNESPF